MGGWSIQEVLKECSGRTARDRGILAACGCSGMASSQEISAAEADASEFPPRSSAFVFLQHATPLEAVGTFLQILAAVEAEKNG